MNDNYPPGVTGNEYEIAGGDEFEEHFDCENVIDYYTIDSRIIENLLGALNYCLNVLNHEKSEYVERPKWVENTMRSRLDEVSKTFQEIFISQTALQSDCGFSGDVLKESYRNEIWWECPECNDKNEIRVDPRGDYES